MMPAADDDGDIRARVNSLEHAEAAMISRLNVLEQWQRTSEIAAARKDEQRKHVDSRFNELDKNIEKVSGVLTKIMWLVLGGNRHGLRGLDRQRRPESPLIGLSGYSAP